MGIVTTWHIQAGDRVRFALWPSDESHFGTVTEVRDSVPQRDPRVHAVENGPHLIINDDRGGQAIVDLLDAQKLED